MPLSPDEQRILDEIEQRLAEEDPRLVEAVSRTSLYTHLARRIKWSLLAFCSFFKPVIIMMALPTAVGGAFLALLLGGSMLGIPSLIGFLMLMVFLMIVPDLLWVAATGFGVMLASALLIYRYLKQLTLDQMRAMQQQSGRFSLTGLLARLAGRFRTPPATPPSS